MSEPTEALAKAAEKLFGDGHIPTDDRPEDNPDAARVLGKRRTDVVPFDQPCELDYHCPVCEYPAMVDGEFDERLSWSEYLTMIWCHVCGKDYPSAFCYLGVDMDRAIATYIASVAGLRRETS